jgi:O-antigen ligase
MNNENIKYYSVSLLLYSLAVAILLGPYFTPFSVFGPEGILRADQVLIPILVTTLVVLHSDRFVIPNNPVVFAIGLIVGFMSLAIFTNAVLYAGTTGIGDLFDVIIWISYLALVVTVPGNISIEQAKQTILVIIGLSTGIALLGILQWYNVSVTTEIIAPLYTTRLDTIGRAPTATLQNPNSLGKLMLLPFFFSLARVYQIYATNSLVGGAQKLSFWSILTTIFAATVIVSKSRSALVGLMFGLAIIVLLITLEQIGDSKKRQNILTVVVVFGFIGLYLVISVFEVGQITNLQNPLQDNSLRTRFSIWENIIPFILERPLLGYGPSKSAQLEVGIPYIDSGYLSWWYHYGLVGLTAFGAVILGGLRTGISTMTNKILFKKNPVFWSTAVAITGWFCGAVVVGGFAGVLQDRRVFTLILLVISLLITAQIKMRESSKPDLTTD